MHLKAWLQNAPEGQLSVTNRAKCWMSYFPPFIVKAKPAWIRTTIQWDVWGKLEYSCTCKNCCEICSISSSHQWGPLGCRNLSIVHLPPVANRTLHRGQTFVVMHRYVGTDAQPISGRRMLPKFLPSLENWHGSSHAHLTNTQIEIRAVEASRSFGLGPTKCSWNVWYRYLPVRFGHSTRSTNDSWKIVFVLIGEQRWGFPPNQIWVSSQTHLCPFLRHRVYFSSRLLTWGWSFWT